MLRTLIISLAILITPAAAYARASADDTKAIDAKVSSFFATVQNGDTKGAYDSFMSPVMSEQQQAMRNIIALTDQVTGYFGGPFTYEKIQESEIGTRLIYREYVLLSDKTPYVVMMTMYRTPKGWVCQAINLRDLVMDDFPKSSSLSQ